MINIEHEYLTRCMTPTDIWEHLPTLRALGEECRSIVELGTRSGNSTVAFLAAKPESLTCYDLSFARMRLDYRGPTRLEKREANTLGLLAEDIPECDLLFIDARHTHDNIAHELTFAPRARKIVAIHDVVKYWNIGENGEPGIGGAILEFMGSAEGRHWRVADVRHNNNGLLVLRRVEA